MDRHRTNQIRPCVVGFFMVGTLTRLKRWHWPCICVLGLASLIPRMKGKTKHKPRMSSAISICPALRRSFHCRRRPRVPENLKPGSSGHRVCRSQAERQTQPCSEPPLLVEMSRHVLVRDDTFTFSERCVPVPGSMFFTVLRVPLAPDGAFVDFEDLWQY